MLNLLSYGLIGQLPWWKYLAITLIMTHITIAAVTIFLHRYQTHRGLELHALPSHFFRLWLWLTTGMVTKEWVAVHRKHHARCESPDDPHSPKQYGIWKVLFTGVVLYKRAAREEGILERYGKLSVDDWLERHVYSTHEVLGLVVMAGIDLLLFGAIGAVIFVLQIVWIPFFAAGVINGVGHYWGYRNFAPKQNDVSVNISPIGLLIGGEELHNNHHQFPKSAKLSYRWFEFDIGWCYIKLLQMFGLARVKYIFDAEAKVS